MRYGDNELHTNFNTETIAAQRLESKRPVRYQGSSNSGAWVSTAIRKAFVIMLLLGGVGCGPGLLSGDQGVEVINVSAPITINEPANGYSTTAPSVTLMGHVSRRDGSFPEGFVYWYNGNSSGSTRVYCPFLCCFMVCTGAWQTDVPIIDGTNTITVTYEGASASVTVERIPVSVITGRVFLQETSAGLTSQDVLVTLSDSTGASPKIAYPDASGNYNYTGLLAGSYTFNPYLPQPESTSCLAFTPASRTVAVTTADVPGQDFAAAPASPCYLIRGQVYTYGNGFAIIGSGNINVYLSDSSGHGMHRVTNTNGYYEFHYLAPGTYTITPEYCYSYSNCSTFSPASTTFTIVNSNAVGQDFLLR